MNTRMRSIGAITAASLLFLLVANCASAQKMQTVPKVDVNRYAGKWYEIASFPQRFQKGCTGTTAEYTVCNDGTVLVTNTCNKGSLSGPKDVAKGKAWVVDKETNAKLKVQFQWPFRGKYWIIDLADDYSYAVVSHPNKKYLWILNRRPQMSEEVYAGIIGRLRAKGFDLTKLNKTQQP